VGQWPAIRKAIDTICATFKDGADLMKADGNGESGDA